MTSPLEARSTAGAFEHHLREAIALNRERAPHYAALTAGRSRRISRVLITSELVLLPVARWFDRRALPYERAGIPLMTSLFVPMAGAAAFEPRRQAPQPGAASPPDVGAIRRRIAAAWAERSGAGLVEAIEDELAQLERTPATECMVRHLLESARRIAMLAPTHAEAARTAGLPDPQPMLLHLLRMHLWGLAAGAMLDDWARPLQLEGIPILAQDLPPIPPPTAVNPAVPTHAGTGAR